MKRLIKARGFGLPDATDLSGLNPSKFESVTCYHSAPVRRSAHFMVRLIGVKIVSHEIPFCPST